MFAAKDPTATVPLDVLQASGRKVPSDVALVGFDDSPVAVQTSPTLTTMR